MATQSGGCGLVPSVVRLRRLLDQAGVLLNPGLDPMILRLTPPRHKVGATHSLCHLLRLLALGLWCLQQHRLMLDLLFGMSLCGISFGRLRLPRSFLVSCRFLVVPRPPPPPPSHPMVWFLEIGAPDELVGR